MHTLQPKHSKLKQQEAEKLLSQFNISLSQLPKISKKDPSTPPGCEVGDVLKIERKLEDGNTDIYFRVII